MFCFSNNTGTEHAILLIQSISIEIDISMMVFHVESSETFIQNAFLLFIFAPFFLDKVCTRILLKVDR